MPGIDPLVYQQAIAQCFPQLDVRTWKSNEEGWSSFVLEINGDLILRFPRRPEIVPGLRREMALLPALARALSVAVPQYDYIWPGDEGRTGVCRWPFVGYRKIAGVPLDAAILSPALAGHIGAVVSELHAFPPARAAELGVPGGDAAAWRQEYVETYSWVRQLVWPLLAETAREEAAALWEAFLAAETNFRFRPVLVHRDLCGEHILCDPAAGRVNGIIDWEDAAIGDPAIDFVGLLWLCGADFTRQVLAHYAGPVEETLWSRVEFYTRIVPNYRVRFGLETGQADEVELGMQEMAQMLRYDPQRYGQQP